MEINIIKNNNMHVKFEIIGEIVPCSRPKFSKFGVYYPKKYTNFKKSLETNIKKMFNIQKEEFINKPLSINIFVYKQIPKSYSKKKRESLKGTYVMSRPDLDNYYKAILDSLSNVFYSDDSCICSLSGSKKYSDRDYEYCVIDINIL